MKYLFPFLVLLGLPLCSQTLDDLAYGTPQTFEVVTWNIEFFPKNDQATVQYVTEIVTALEADVIAMQEIDDYFAFVDLIGFLPDYDGYFQSINGRGLGYLYRKDVVQINAGYEILTGEPENDNFPRFPMVLEITYGGEEFVLINNHFKCCGNGILEIEDPFDEETRRYNASVFLKEYIDTNFQNKSVILLGDLNDLLTDPEEDNVFLPFLQDEENYLFADMAIAEGSFEDWSFPNWPSHLDHILITKDVFPLFNQEETITETLKIEDFLAGGFQEYDANVSDHRPVGVKFPLEEIVLLSSKDEISQQQKIDVYPTLIDDYFSIKSDTNYHFKVLNQWGQVLLVGKNNTATTTVDVAGFSTGIYYLNLTTHSGELITKRIIKK